MLENLNKSYLSHKDNISKIDIDRLFYQKNKSSFGYFRIKQPLDLLSPLLQSKNKWLTIGDLNGLEANYMIEHDQDVLASDISAEFLKIVHEEGLIDKYEAVNVEAIPYPDNHFDYCLCKEAYHHFPRAYLGLYEMIRVSSKATIIIEPIDAYFKMPILLFLKNILDRFNPMLINKIWKNRFSFETVGNYVFKLSDREVEKIAMGMGLPCIAFKGINLSYKEIDESIQKAPYSKSTNRKYSKDIYFKNILSALGIIPPNVLCAIIFKTVPNPTERESLKNLGFQIIDLPKNPYL